MGVVLSEGWRLIVKEYTCNTNLAVLPNPVKAAQYEVSRPWEHDAMSPKVLCMGRLGRGKGTYDIVEAIPSVLKKTPDALFVFGGDGDVEEVATLCMEKGVSHNVNILGWVKDEQKLRCYREADVYVLPSYHEGQPISVLEAMAAGLPVVSTPVGGIPEAIEEGVNGFLVQPGDVDGLADRINRLLGDPILRKEMGLRNKAKIRERFDVDVVSGKLGEIYASLVNSGGTHG